MTPPMMAHDAPAYDRQSWATVDVRELEADLVDRTLELNRELPRGARPLEVRRLETDFTRRGQPTLSRWLRLALAGIRAGQDARLYGEAVADVLGAVAATVLPVSDASLAETLAECSGDPRQEMANRPDATPEQVLDAARAMEAEAQAAKLAAISYRRRYREMIRRESGL